MKIAIVTPAAARSRSGNRNTARRWAGLLRELGHRVSVAVEWDGKPADLMLALHARRSHSSIARFCARHPDRPLVLALTGTDLYRDIRSDAGAQESMRLASRMIVLQEAGLTELAPRLRRKTRVIHQSAAAVPRGRPLARRFEVAVIGHLREEKDPFRAAAALAHVPAASPLCVTHLGRAMSPEMERAARQWMAREPRYRWLGEVPHGRARRLLARARALVVSSRMEGGANVVSEALASGVPVLASRISGNVGLLGARYPGCFPLEDERALARLLLRIERDPRFLERLRAACAARRPLTSRRREKAALRRLLAELRLGKSS